MSYNPSDAHGAAVGTMPLSGRSVARRLLVLGALGVAAVAAAVSPPPNDGFDAAAPWVIPVPTTLRVDTAGATTEPGEPSACGPIGATLWYVAGLTEAAAGPLTIDTAGSDFDTVLAVYTGPDLRTLEPVDCNDDATGYGLQSRIDFVAVPGLTYFVQVGGYEGTTGLLALTGSSTLLRPP